MVRICDGCERQMETGESRSWCHACGLLLCGDCWHRIGHDHVHHLARQQVMKMPSDQFDWQPSERPV